MRLTSLPSTKNATDAISRPDTRAVKACLTHPLGPRSRAWPETAVSGRAPPPAAGVVPGGVVPGGVVPGGVGVGVVPGGVTVTVFVSLSQSFSFGGAWPLGTQTSATFTNEPVVPAGMVAVHLYVQVSPGLRASSVVTGTSGPASHLLSVSVTWPGEKTTLPVFFTAKVYVTAVPAGAPVTH